MCTWSLLNTSAHGTPGGHECKPITHITHPLSSTLEGLSRSNHESRTRDESDVRVPYGAVHRGFAPSRPPHNDR